MCFASLALVLSPALQTAAAAEFTLDAPVYDQQSPTSIWAAGPDWKAEFTVDGVTFVPFLGSDAPRDFPTRFVMDEVTVGGRDVALERPTEVVRHGDEIRIDHGLVTEIYHCGPEGIEQSFLFERRDHAGEVVVRLDVDSELVGDDSASELFFRGPRGGVRYGEAFVFDDEGRGASVRRRFDGGSIELTVPGTFPRDSELTLDPHISTWWVSPASHVAHSADVAFERDLGTQGNYAVVYERVFSATDSDVYLSYYDPATNAFSSYFVVDASSDDWKTPRIAASDPSDRMLVVASVRPDGVGDRSIKSRLVLGIGGLQSVMTVNGNAGDHFQPDVGAASTGSGDTGFVVVWCRSGLVGRGDLYACHVDGDGFNGAGDVQLSVDWAKDEQRPRISATTGRFVAGQSSRYNVVWERRQATGESDVYCARLAIDANVARAPFAITTTGDAVAPSVSVTADEPYAGTSSFPFMVSFVKDLGNSQAMSMIGVCDTVGLRSTVNASRMLDVTGSFQDTQDVVVESVGSRWVLVQSLRYISTAFDCDVSMATFDLVENGAQPAIAFASRHSDVGLPSQLAQRDISFASESAAGGTRAYGFATWSVEHGTNELDKGVAGALVYAAITHAPIGIQYCDAVRNSTNVSGWMAAYGTQATTGTKRLFAYDLPVGAFAFFLVAPQSGDVLGPGGSAGRLCLGGSVGRYSNQVGQVVSDGTYQLLVDAQQLSQPNGAVAAQAGETWFFQCWHRDSDGGVTTSNFTNAVAVPFH